VSRRNKPKGKKKRVRPLGHVTLPPPVAPPPQAVEPAPTAREPSRPAIALPASAPTARPASAPAAPSAEPAPSEARPRRPSRPDDASAERTPLPRPVPAPLSQEEPAPAPRIPRRTPWIGAAAGLLLFLPLACASLLLGAAFHLRAPTPVDRLFVVALVFAGLPALISGWGIARLAAYRALEVPVYRVLRTAIGHASATAIIAGAGLAILIAVPLGGTNELASAWALQAGLGGLTALPGGIALGWWAARRPLY
jgi:hypothetical protein